MRGQYSVDEKEKERTNFVCNSLTLDLRDVGPYSRVGGWM